MAHVLLAEDDIALSQIVTLWLEHAGHTVDVVENGMEGILAATMSDVDLLITDVMMPDCDGEALADAFKGLDRSKPILVVTALTEGDKLDTMLQHPAVTKVLFKPLLHDKFLCAVSEALSDS